MAHYQALGCGEVLVVENGSSDATAARARSSGATLLQLPQAGYGSAVAAGQAHLSSRWDWTLVVSADGSDAFAPGEAEQWVSAAAGADLVLGDRTALRESRAHLTPPQLWGSYVFSRLVRWGWGHRFNDMGSRRLIRNARWSELALRDRQFGWNVEMQVKAVEAGWGLSELPASYHPRRQGTSKISSNFRGTVRASVGIVGCLARLYWQHCSRSKPAPVTRPQPSGILH